MKLPDFYEQVRAEVDAELDRLLPAETLPPPSVHRAMRYSVFAGGKRLRPVLCIEAARVFADKEESLMRAALQAGCAIEFLHTYSLIHDDLPALDNDDLRRGMPTCHRKFGEAHAILAGDALLTLAFECLAKLQVEPRRCVAVLREVASAAGTVNGMIGGQVADIEAEGGRAGQETLEYIHRSKTAALFRATLAAGALCGGADDGDAARMRSFGEFIGWAFQVVDDILDVEESSEALGKTAGKDAAQRKATYPALVGMEASRRAASELLQRALEQLAPFEQGAARLRQLAEFLVARRA
jgi:geranylgeranyl diphosphate synthase type II